LPYHLLHAGDLSGLNELVRTGFLEKKARVFGDMEGLIDSRQIAETQAKSGDRHWDDLVRSAYAYCDFAERMTSSERKLESLIAGGQMDRVRALIQSEPLPERQAALMLACAALCAEHQHVTAANDLWREGLRLRATAQGKLGWHGEYVTRALIEHENQRRRP
jgi:hypothetical protein